MIFFIVQEYKAIINQLDDIEWKKLLRGKNLQSSIKLVPFVFLVDYLVFFLALYIAIDNSSMVSRDGSTFFEADVRACGQWQISAFTVTLAWLNLLFYMRLLSFGKYLILIQDVIQTFWGIVFVGLLLVAAFASGFHMLLSNRENFEYLSDSMLKTVIMLTGEFDYGEIFFKEKPPVGFSGDWDKGHEHVPFPFITYTLFIAFFFLSAIVALNVLVGLIVDATSRNFIEMADLRIMSMRLHYILAQERGYLKSFVKRWERRKDGKDRETNMIEIKRDWSRMGPSTLMSKARIWEKVLQTKRLRKRKKSDINEQNTEFKKLTQDFMKMKNEMAKQSQPQIQGRIASIVDKWRGKDKLKTIEGTTANKYLKDMQNQKDNQINRIQRDIDEIKKDNAEIKKDIDEIKNDNAEIKKDNAEIKKDIVEIRKDNDEIKKDVDEIRRDNDEVKKDLKWIIHHLSSEASSNGRRRPERNGAIVI